MCITCRRAVAAPVEQPKGNSRLDAPLSRADMLKVMGGGLAVALAAGSPAATLARSAGKDLPYVVLIVLDGARAEYFDTPGIPTVKRLVERGTQYTNAFAGILESETPSGHVAIGTGSEPRTTGIVSFWWANNENREVSLFDPSQMGDLEDMVRRSGVSTLAGQVHAANSKARVVALSGSKYYAASGIGGPDADVIMYFNGTPNGLFAPTYVPGHAPNPAVLSTPGLVTRNGTLPLGLENHLAMKLAATAFQHTRQHVTLINLPEFDWPLGHVNGGIVDHQGVTALMRGFDRDLAVLQEVYRKAGVLDQTTFVLMADHGMVPLRARVDKESLVDAIHKTGSRIAADTYTSGCFFWLTEESKAVQAAQNIVKLRNPHIQSVYARVKSGRGYVYVRVSSSNLLKTAAVDAANQYLLHTFNGTNAPDLVVLFTEGVGSEPDGQAGWKADHGGASWQSQHLPLILSGPGIRVGHISSSPARLIDVAPTVLATMGLSSGRMQGTVLADALERPSRAAVNAQARVNAQLKPLVAALQQESQRELGG